MALTASQQAAYDTLVAQGRQDFANQFAAAMTSVNAGIPVEQATKEAFAAPAPTSTLFSAPAPAPVAQPVAQPAYFQANPDVAAAFRQNSYGLTPDQFAATHFQKYGVNEQRAAPTPAPVATPAQIANTPGLGVAGIGVGGAALPGTQPFVLGQSTLPVIETRYWDLGEAMVPQYFIKGTDIQVDEPTYTELATQSDSAGPRVANPITIYDESRQGTHTYSPSGEYIGFNYGPRDDSLFGFVKDVVKGTAPIWTAVLAANAGSLFGGAGTGAAGTAAVTDAGLLAADAAQLASQGLSESAISQVLGSAGYASTPAANLAASMAANGLDVATMTQQLGNLSANTGLMSQTGSAADFVAADALQLQGQVGNNFAAIEQNLAASGVDPLIAADISQQIAFNPNLTQTELATNLSNSFGNNIYDVNMATTYPTSVLPDTGGLMNAPAAGVVAGSATGSGATAGATAGAGLTNSQIANLIKAGLGVASAAGAVNAVGSRPTTPLQAPTQGMPTYSPEYYQQLQQYYNAYLPQTPRDVVSPLQQWYNSSYGA